MNGSWLFAARLVVAALALSGTTKALSQPLGEPPAEPTPPLHQPPASQGTQAEDAAAPAVTSLPTPQPGDDEERTLDLTVGDEDPSWSLSVNGHQRFVHRELTDFPLDTEGVRHGHQVRGSVSTNLGLSLRWRETAKLKVQLELVDAQVYGGNSLIGQEAQLEGWYAAPLADQLHLAELYIQAPVGIGVLKAGRMHAKWGLGLLANPGTDKSFWAEPTYGDVVNRAMLITRPLQPFLTGDLGRSLVLTAGVDLVEHDDQAARAEGDTVWQGVGALLFRRPAWQLGTYVAYRHQTRASGDVTEVLAVDLYGAWSRSLGDETTLKLEAEAALLQGTTEDVAFEGVPGAVDVQQVGVIARASVVPEHDGVLAQVDLGVAPGDNAPQDSTLRSVRFDPNYRVGMILFEDVLARMTARSVDHATDPGLVAVPAHGFQRIPSGGAVHNAAFLAPQVGLRLLNQRLEVRAGGLIAMAAGDLFDPYQSSLGGGFVHSAFGQPNARGLLAAEVNVGAVWRQPLPGQLSLDVGVRYGALIPGEALQDAQGEDVLGILHKGAAFSAVRW